MLDPSVQRLTKALVGRLRKLPKPLNKAPQQLLRALRTQQPRPGRHPVARRPILQRAGSRVKTLHLLRMVLRMA